MPKFDLSKTLELVELFATPRDDRDDAWIARFYATVPDATLMSFPAQVENGPDSFPYFQLSIPDPGPVTPFCITHVLDDVLDNGYGIVIFGDSSRSAAPEWVFTYGDLLSYSLYGRFDGEPPEPSAEGAPPEAGRNILKAAPSESYLPARARRALGRYMRDVIHHPDPKVSLYIDSQLHPARNLMVNLTLEQYDGDAATLDAAMDRMLWYVPTTYSLVVMPPEWTDEGFIPLE